MANYYSSQFAWSYPDNNTMGFIAGSQGFTVERLEMTLQVPTPATATTLWYVNLNRGGTASTNEGTIPTCPLRDNTIVAATKVLYDAVGTADPNLTGNSVLTEWQLRDNAFIDFPGGGIWVPPGSGLYLNALGNQGAFYYNLYFWE